MTDEAKKRYRDNRRRKTEVLQAAGLLPPYAKADKLGMMAWWTRHSRLEGDELVWQLPAGVSVNFIVHPDGRQKLQAAGHGGYVNGPQVARLKVIHAAVAAGERLRDLVDLVVDHCSGDPTDDCLENLQLVSNRKNSTLRGGRQLPGVSWDERSRRWVAASQHDGRPVQAYFSLGTYGPDARSFAVEARRELLRLARAEDVLENTELSDLSDGQAAIAVDKARTAWSRAMSRPAKARTEEQRRAQNAWQNARNARIKAERRSSS